MFGLWFDAQKNGSNALQEALGPDTCAYGNPELTKEVEKMRFVGFEAMDRRDI
jgi:hypothetical protein